MEMSARSIFLIWIVIAAASSPANGTCVLDSDFGFTLNCGFKQSGLFRVRNLGGVKGYWGLGFSVGDELGFKQSLSNVEGNRRRSAQGGSVAAAVAKAASQGTRRRSPTSSPSADVSASVIRTVKAPTLVAVPVGTATKVALPAFHALPKTSLSRSSDAGEDFRNSLGDFIKLPQSTSQSLQRAVTLQAVAPPTTTSKRAQVAVKPDALSTRTLGSSEPAPTPSKPATTLLSPSAIGQSMEAIAKASNVSVQTVASAIAAKLRRRQQALEQAAKDASAGAVAASQLQNVGAVVKKQQQRPKPSALASSRGRVMNAPREYYPVGYDKDFDDGFAARVDLPDTSFACGNQKHFPGLYADEDLGCMVFHVCALTDEGLIMKSFLCPESTLFDQTILKCNWWFYVDCKASRKLYDSNIPVSKSYQLMKALAFFSSYKS
ncbi:streptococcal hemagglutinin [Hetaerina americana]|uniref:streptococcal hemagglutinin n=1 Tax=Hetaerina americana TaxID=62018 RepID=UPI003A7F51B7